MNNFRKYYAFYNYIFVHEHPQGGAESTRSSPPPPPPHIKKLYLGGLFPILGGPFYVEGGGTFPTYDKKFLGLFPLTKLSVGVHALAARVVANISPWGNLREFVTINLLIHSGAHIHILLRTSMK